MEDYKKPILLVTFLPGTAVEMTRRFGLPVFGNPERAVGSMQGLIEYGGFVRKAQEGLFTPKPRTGPKKSRSITGDESLDEHQGKQILADYGIPVTREEVARTKAEALSIARDIGFPIAVKILSPAIRHKTDQGGVILSISDETEMDRAVTPNGGTVSGLERPSETGKLTHSGNGLAGGGGSFRDDQRSSIRTPPGPRFRRGPG